MAVRRRRGLRDVKRNVGMGEGGRGGTEEGRTRVRGGRGTERQKRCERGRVKEGEGEGDDAAAKCGPDPLPTGL